MKKKILGSLLIICVLFSYGLAKAAIVSQADLPKHLQSAVPGNYALWFPAVPSVTGYLDSYIIIANLYGEDMTISITATAFDTAAGNQPAIKSYLVAPYEKLILTLNDFGFSNTIADIWITSTAPIFGATELLLDSNTFDSQPNPVGSKN